MPSKKLKLNFVNKNTTTNSGDGNNNDGDAPRQQQSPLPQNNNILARLPQHILAVQYKNLQRLGVIEALKKNDACCSRNDDDGGEGATKKQKRVSEEEEEEFIFGDLSCLDDVDLGEIDFCGGGAVEAITGGDSSKQGDCGGGGEAITSGAAPTEKVIIDNNANLDEDEEGDRDYFENFLEEEKSIEDILGITCAAIAVVVAPPQKQDEDASIAVVAAPPQKQYEETPTTLFFTSDNEMPMDDDDSDNNDDEDVPIGNSNDDLDFF